MSERGRLVPLFTIRQRYKKDIYLPKGYIFYFRSIYFPLRFASLSLIYFGAFLWVVYGGKMCDATLRSALRKKLLHLRNVYKKYFNLCASLRSAIPSSVMIEVHYYLTRFASLRIKKYCSLPNRYKNISNRYATLRFLFVCYGGCSVLRFAQLTILVRYVWVMESYGEGSALRFAYLLLDDCLVMCLVWYALRFATLPFFFLD